MADGGVAQGGRRPVWREWRASCVCSSLERVAHRQLGAANKWSTGMAKGVSGRAGKGKADTGRAQPSPRDRAKAWLLSHGSPRFLMSLMLASTIGCGFLASVAMHHLGVNSPKWRYPFAVLAAWAVFLALVSLWVWAIRRQNALAEQRADEQASRGLDGGNRQQARSGSRSSFDLPSGGSSSGSGGSGGSGGSSWGGGGGGRFGGGGASGSFDEMPAQGFTSGFASGSNPGSAIGGADFSESLAAADGAGAGGDGGGLLGGGSGGSGGTGGSGGSGSSWGLGDIDLGDDAGAFIIVVIAVIVVAAAVFGIAFYAVYSAPTFFAELLIDGGVGTWLYKRAKVSDEPDWLGTAVRRTLWPAAAALLLFWLFGGLIEFMAPGASTVGQALQATHRSH